MVKKSKALGSQSHMLPLTRLTCHYGSVYSADWGDRVWQGFSKKYLACKFPHLAALWVPDVPAAEHRTMCDFLNWVGVSYSRIQTHRITHVVLRF
jgi:hypothetical protein